MPKQKAPTGGDQSFFDAMGEMTFPELDLDNMDLSKMPGVQVKSSTKVEKYVDGKLVHYEETSNGQPVASQSTDPNLPSEHSRGKQEVPLFPSAPQVPGGVSQPGAVQPVGLDLPKMSPPSAPPLPSKPQTPGKPTSPAQEKPGGPSFPSAMGVNFPFPDSMSMPEGFQFPEGVGHTTTKTETWIDGKLVHSEETSGGRPLPPPGPQIPGKPSHKKPTAPNVEASGTLKPSGGGVTEPPKPSLPGQPSFPTQPTQGSTFPPGASVAPVWPQTPQWGQSFQWPQQPQWAQFPQGEGYTTTKTETWVDGKLVHSEETSGGRPLPPSGPQVPGKPGHQKPTAPSTEPSGTLKPSGGGVTEPTKPSLPGHPSYLTQGSPFPPGTSVAPGWPQTPQWGQSLQWSQQPQWAQFPQGESYTTTKTETWVDGKLVHSEETSGGKPGAPLTPSTTQTVGGTPGKQKPSPTGKALSGALKSPAVAPPGSFVFPPQAMPFPSIVPDWAIPPSPTIPDWARGSDWAQHFQWPQQPRWSQLPEGTGQTTTKIEKWVDGKLVHHEETVEPITPSAPRPPGKPGHVRPTKEMPGAFKPPHMVPGGPPFQPREPASIEWAQTPEWTLQTQRFPGAVGQTTSKTETWVDGKLVKSERSSGRLGIPPSASQSPSRSQLTGKEWSGMQKPSVPQPEFPPGSLTGLAYLPKPFVSGQPSISFQHGWAQHPQQPEGVGKTTTKTETWVDGKLVHSKETTGGRLVVPPGAPQPPKKPQSPAKPPGIQKPKGKSMSPSALPVLPLQGLPLSLTPERIQGPLQPDGVGQTSDKPERSVIVDDKLIFSDEPPGTPLPRSAPQTPVKPTKHSSTLPMKESSVTLRPTPPQFSLSDMPTLPKVSVPGQPYLPTQGLPAIAGWQNQPQWAQQTQWAQFPQGESYTTTKTETWVDGKLVHSEETSGGRPVGQPGAPLLPSAPQVPGKLSQQKPTVAGREPSGTLKPTKSLPGMTELSKPSIHGQPSFPMPGPQFTPGTSMTPGWPQTPSMSMPGVHFPSGMMAPPDWAQQPQWAQFPQGESYTTTKTETWVDGKLVHSEETSGGRPVGPPGTPLPPLAPQGPGKISQQKPRAPGREPSGTLKPTKSLPGMIEPPKPSMPGQPSFPMPGPQFTPGTSMTPGWPQTPGVHFPSGMMAPPEWAQQPQWAQFPQWAQIPQGEGYTTTKTETWVDGKLVHSEETSEGQPVGRPGAPVQPSAPKLPGKLSQQKPTAPGREPSGTLKPTKSLPGMTEAPKPSIPGQPSFPLPGLQFTPVTSITPGWPQTPSMSMPGVHFPSGMMAPPDWAQQPQWAQFPQGEGYTTTKTETWVDGKLVHSEETSEGQPVGRPGAPLPPSAPQVTGKLSQQKPTAPGREPSGTLKPIKSVPGMSEAPKPSIPGQPSFPTSGLPFPPGTSITQGWPQTPSMSMPGVHFPSGMMAPPDWAQGPQWAQFPQGEGYTTTKTETWVDGKLVHSEETSGGWPVGRPGAQVPPSAPQVTGKLSQQKPILPGKEPSVTLKPTASLPRTTEPPKPSTPGVSITPGWPQTPSMSMPGVHFPSGMMVPPDWAQHPQLSQQPQWAQFPQGVGQMTTKTETWVDGKLVHSEETVVPITPSTPQTPGKPKSKLPKEPSKQSVAKGKPTSAPGLPLLPLQGIPLPSVTPSLSQDSKAMQKPDLSQLPGGMGQTTTKTEMWVDGKLVHSEESTGGRPVGPPGTTSHPPSSSQASIKETLKPADSLTTATEPPKTPIPGHPAGMSMTPGWPQIPSMSMPGPHFPSGMMVPPDWTQQPPQWPQVPGAVGKTTTKIEKWVDGKLVYSEETSSGGSLPPPGAPVPPTTPQAPGKPEKKIVTAPSREISGVMKQPSVPQGMPAWPPGQPMWPTRGVPFQSVTTASSESPEQVQPPQWGQIPGGVGRSTTKTERWVDGKLVYSEEVPTSFLVPPAAGVPGPSMGFPSSSFAWPPSPSFRPSQVPAFPSQPFIPLPDWAQLPEDAEGETYSKTQYWVDGKLVHSEEKKGGRPIGPSIAPEERPRVPPRRPDLSRTPSTPRKPIEPSASELPFGPDTRPSLPQGGMPSQTDISVQPPPTSVQPTQPVSVKTSTTPLKRLSSEEARRKDVPVSIVPLTPERITSAQPSVSPSLLPLVGPSFLSVPGAPSASYETVHIGSPSHDPSLLPFPPAQGQPPFRPASVPAGSFQQMPDVRPKFVSTTIETYYRHPSGKEHALIWKDGVLVHSGEPLEKGPSMEMPRWDTTGSLVSGSSEPFWLETYYKHASGKEFVQVWKDGELVYEGDPHDRPQSLHMPHFHPYFHDKKGDRKKPTGAQVDEGIIEPTSVEPSQHLDSNISRLRHANLKESEKLALVRGVTIGEEFWSERESPLKRVKNKFDVTKKSVSIIHRGSLYEDEISNVDVDEVLQNWKDRASSAVNLEFRVQQKAKEKGSRFSLGDGFSKSTVFASSRDLMKQLSDERCQFVSTANVKVLESAEKVPVITMNDTAWPRHALTEYDQIYDGLLTTTVLNPALAVLHGEHILIRGDHRQSMRHKVKIISGGKAGLEPLFTGYVGRGMLTAAIIGDLTEVPKVQAVYSAIVEMSCEGKHSAGTLIIIPNDFETRVVFGLALEKARQKNYPVEMVVISDSVIRNTESKTKYETLSGIVLAFKLAGAMSEDGRLLREIEWSVKGLLLASSSALILSETQSAIKSSLYDAGRPFSTKSFPDLIARLLGLITDSKHPNSLPLTPCNKFVVMINCHDANEICLSATVLQVVKRLQMSGVEIERLYKGTFASCDRGITITLMKTYENCVIEYLDEPTDVRCWPRQCKTALNRHFNKTKSSYDIHTEIIPSIVDLSDFPDKSAKGPNFPEKLQYFLPYILQTVTDELTQLEDKINCMDPKNIFGTAVAEGFRFLATSKWYKCGNEAQFIDFTNPHRLFTLMALAAERATRSCHAYLLSLVYNSLANSFLNSNDSDEANLSMLGTGLLEAGKMVKIYARIKNRQPSIADSLSALGKCLIEFEEEEGLDALFDKMEKITDNVVESSCKALPSKKHLRGEPEPGNYTVAVIVKSIELSRKKNWSII